MPAGVEPRVRQAEAMLRSGRFAEAAGAALEVLRARPGDAEAALVAARAARELDRGEEAVRVLQGAIAAGARHPAIEEELAASLVAAHRPREAIPRLREIVARRPDAPFGHYWLGMAHLRLFEAAPAIACFERARRLEPSNPETLMVLGTAHLSAGRPAEAVRLLREYLAARPGRLQAMQALASALEADSRLDEAAEVWARVLEIAPGHPPAAAGRARYHQARGEYEPALALIEPLVRAGRTNAALATTYGHLCAATGRIEEGRRAVEASLAARRYPAQMEAGLLFARGRLEDAAGNHDAAFADYARGNALFPRTFDRQARRRFTDELIATFTRERLASLPRASVRSERPVLVVGMPRSGTTLVEQIIASHPRGFGAGELPHLRQIVHRLGQELGGGGPRALAGVRPERLDAAAGEYLASLRALDAVADRVVDKMPHNFEVLGMASRLLPGARIIHCQRDPMDTCVSCFTTQFSPVHNYSNDLGDLGFAYGEYRRLMDHWRAVLDVPMLEVAYEGIVDDVEGSARRIVEFLGLGWDERCLRYHENARMVATASMDQVRRPVYRSSVGRWRRYERHLGPLREALAAAGVAAG